jgi:hypothetical protein
VYSCRRYKQTARLSLKHPNHSTLLPSSLPDTNTALSFTHSTLYINRLYPLTQPTHTHNTVNMVKAGAGSPTNTLTL